MAIYHFSARVIGRSQGRSVVAAAAYRAAARLHDEHLGRGFDYSAKPGVVHSEILLPKGAPAAWTAPPEATGEARDAARAALWNAVEAAERRRDSQLARDLEIALPRELGRAEAVRLVRDFVAEQCVARGMVADLNVHWGIARDGTEQPHAHVLLTMRRAVPGADGQGPDSFGRKEVAWNDRGLLRGWRERWADLANERLAAAGLDLRLDHRSLAEQGLDLAPQNKIGPAGARRELRGEAAERVAEHRAIARSNGERLLADPGLALLALTHQQSTFTRADLARLVHRQSDGAEQFDVVMAAVRAHPELLVVGRDGHGRERFSTRAMVATEAAMVADAAALAGRTAHAVDLERLRAAMDGPELGEEQRRALAHVLGPQGLAAVVGYAGSGKSTLLGVARRAWEAEGCRVRGTALSGIAAEGLETGSGIGSRTLHSLLHTLDSGREALGPRDVVVLDEAGMVGSRQLAALLGYARSAGAKLVLVGDPEQLQAIEAGAAFRAVVERVGAAEITTVVRQRQGWQREATRDLAGGRTAGALVRYRDGGMVHGHRSDAEALAGVVRDWDKARRAGVSRIMLAHTRAAVAELNARAREAMRAAGLLGEEQVVATQGGPRAFAPGDQLYFLRNDRDLGVRNGTLGTVEAMTGCAAAGDLRLRVRLAGEKPGQVRRVVVEPAAYGWLEHGYAATVHKAQGVTVERALVLATPGMDRHLAYVALSRHRGRVELHWSAEAFGRAGGAGLVAMLSRERVKDTALDYGLEAEGLAEPVVAYAGRRGLHPLAPASEILVRREVATPAPVSTPPPRPALPVAETLRAAAVLRTAGEALRQAATQDPEGTRHFIRQRLEDRRLRAALLAALPELERRLALRTARLRELAGGVAALPARMAEALRPVAPAAAPRPSTVVPPPPPPSTSNTTQSGWVQDRVGSGSAPKPILPAYLDHLGRDSHGRATTPEAVAAVVQCSAEVEGQEQDLMRLLTEAYRDATAARARLQALIEAEEGDRNRAAARLKKEGPEVLGRLAGRDGLLATRASRLARARALNAVPGIAGNLWGMAWQQEVAARRYLASVRTQQERDATVIPGLSEAAWAAVRSVEGAAWRGWIDTTHRQRWGRGVVEYCMAEVGVAWGREVVARPEVAAELRVVVEAATRRLGENEVYRLRRTAELHMMPPGAHHDPPPTNLAGLARVLAAAAEGQMTHELLERHAAQRRLDLRQAPAPQPSPRMRSSPSPGM